MIEACPNSDIFFDWSSIFEYINGFRNLSANKNHIKTLCHIVVESAKLLKDRVNNETTADADVEAQREKLKDLVRLLPRYLRHYETNPEIVGELLFVYQHIDLHMHLGEMEEMEAPVITIHGNCEGLKLNTFTSLLGTHEAASANHSPEPSEFH